MFEYDFGMINSFGDGSGFRNASGFRSGSGSRHGSGSRYGDDGGPRMGPDRQPRNEPFREERRAPAASADGPLQAMSPGVVDYLFRQLVAGNPAEDVQWGREGIPLSAQPPGAELARRLSETDLEA